MGKGTVVSGGEDGFYSVTLSYNRDRYNATLDILNDNLEKLQAESPDLTEEYAESLAALDAVTGTAQAYADEYESWVILYQQYVHSRDVIQSQLNALEVDLQYYIDIGANEHTIDQIRDQITAKEAEKAENGTLLNEAFSESKKATANYGKAFSATQSASADLAIVQAKISGQELSIAAVEKRIEYLESNMPADETVSAWCADLTTEITGEVGTIEVPGERGVVQIQPGFFETQVYDEDRDGQLFPLVSMTAAQVFYNMAMFPGWQKWTPTFRHGTITAITGDIADVELESATSSLLDMSINRVDTLSDVEIEYMYCNGAAFAEDDNVLVMFSKTDGAQARFDDLDSLKENLASLLREKAVLELGRYGLSIDQLEEDVPLLLQELDNLNDDLSDLSNASPVDSAAVAAKEAEIVAKQDEITAKQDEINAIESDIEDAESEIGGKQVEINAKKAAITAKANEIKNNMADLAHPKIIGFKDHPKPCAIPCGIFGSTQYLSHFTDPNFVAWTHGEYSEASSYNTGVPEDKADWNNAWGPGMVVSVGAEWELPFVGTPQTYYRMALNVTILISCEDGSSHSIPMVFEYDQKDKKMGPGNFSIAAYTSGEMTYNPFYYSPDSTDCAYDFFRYYTDSACNMGFQSYKYWISNYNAIKFYRAVFYYYHYIDVHNEFLVCHPEGERSMGMYLYGLSSPVVETVDGAVPIASDHQNFLSDGNVAGALTVEEEQECYLTQTWSMAGIIDDTGLVLNDTTDDINFPDDKDTAPFGPFGLSNAGAGEILIDIPQILNRHHVSFKVDGIKTDDGKLVVVATGDFDDLTHGPLSACDNAGAAQFYIAITRPLDKE